MKHVATDVLTQNYVGGCEVDLFLSGDWFGVEFQ